MCKAKRQRLHMKVYLCCIAKYSLISYLNTKYEKDLPFISFYFSSRGAFYLLRAFPERMPYYQPPVFPVLI
jgi:hypothetical protein